MKNIEAVKKSGALKVKGATIYYEIRGAGPVLLMISGGGCDANSYDDVADYLAEWYTVVTYDRRGYSRSLLDNPEEFPSIGTHADDAHLLLQKLTSLPAFVFGNSAGAIVGLELVTRYPEQVRVFVAHEPPKALSSNPEDDKIENVKKIIAEGGYDALKKYIGVGHSSKKSAIDAEEGKREVSGEARRMKVDNMKFFLNKEPKAIEVYNYDLEKLKSASKQVKIIIGGSTTAHEAVGYQGAIMAAKFFEINIVEFPGNHTGYRRAPKEFARILRESLGDA